MKKLKVKNLARPFFDMRIQWERFLQDTRFGTQYVTTVGGEDLAELLTRIRKLERHVRNNASATAYDPTDPLGSTPVAVLKIAQRTLEKCEEADSRMAAAQTFIGRHLARRALKAALTFK